MRVHLYLLVCAIICAQLKYSSSQVADLFGTNCDADDDCPDFLLVYLLITNVAVILVTTLLTLESFRLEIKLQFVQNWVPAVPLTMLKVIVAPMENASPTLITMVYRQVSASVQLDTTGSTATHLQQNPTQAQPDLPSTRLKDLATTDPSSQSSGVELFSSSSSSPGEAPPLPQPLAKWMLISL
ncbi:uncharacterized protein LOC111110447 [Crassostrea virginica]